MPSKLLWVKKLPTCLPNQRHMQQSVIKHKWFRCRKNQLGIFLGSGLDRSTFLQCMLSTSSSQEPPINLRNIASRLLLYKKILNKITRDRFTFGALLTSTCCPSIRVGAAHIVKTSSTSSATGVIFSYPTTCGSITCVAYASACWLKKNGQQSQDNCWQGSFSNFAQP